jgi:hypothetical protein
MADSYIRALRAAAYTLLGEDRLALSLGVPLEDLQRWLRNEGDPPVQVVIDASDIVALGYRKRRLRGAVPRV